MANELKDALPFDPYVEIQGDHDNEYAKLIKKAYADAIEDRSNLPDWILNMRGMSGKRYRHFVNNLVSLIPDPRYLEIGS